MQREATFFLRQQLTSQLITATTLTSSTPPAKAILDTVHQHKVDAAKWGRGDLEEAGSGGDAGVVVELFAGSGDGREPPSRVNIAFNENDKREVAEMARSLPAGPTLLSMKMTEKKWGRIHPVASR